MTKMDMKILWKNNFSGFFEDQIRIMTPKFQKYAPEIIGESEIFSVYNCVKIVQISGDMAWIYDMTL